MASLIEDIVNQLWILPIMAVPTAVGSGVGYVIERVKGNHPADFTQAGMMAGLVIGTLVACYLMAASSHLEMQLRMSGKESYLKEIAKNKE